jgi:NADPH2 dehydrogenase
MLICDSHARLLFDQCPEMRMKNPVPTFAHLIRTVKRLYPSLLYLHVVEPRISGNNDASHPYDSSDDSNDFLREIWKPKAFISAGGYSRESAIRRAEEPRGEGELVAVGRYFISNVGPLSSCWPTRSSTYFDGSS